MTKRFEKVYNALINAFFDGTLAKGNCTCCAVGNIVADAQGGVISLKDGTINCTTPNHFWNDLFTTIPPYQYMYFRRYKNREHPFKNEKEIENLVIELEELTDYSCEELAKIENVFENNTKIIINCYDAYTEQEILEDQYNGLCAVFEVLCQFDNITTVDYKQKLQEKQGLILI